MVLTRAKHGTRARANCSGATCSVNLCLFSHIGPLALHLANNVERRMLKQCLWSTYASLLVQASSWSAKRKQNAPSSIHTELLAMRICGLPFQQEWYNETYCTATWYQTTRDGERGHTVIFKCDSSISKMPKNY